MILFRNQSDVEEFCEKCEEARSFWQSANRIAEHKKLVVKGLVDQCLKRELGEANFKISL